MSRLIALVAVLALGIAAWQALEAGSVRDVLQDLQAENAGLKADVARVAQGLAWLQGQAPTERPQPLPQSPREAALAAGEDPGPTLLPAGSSPEVIAKAVRDLQERVSAQEGRVEDVAQRVDAAAQQGVAWRAPRFLRDVNQASSALDLSPRQRADLERVVEDTKRELDSLWSLPNEEGKSWAEVSKPRPLTTASAGGDGSSTVAVLMADFAEIQRFRSTRVPGSSETYAQAEQRIRERGKADARGLLTPEQQKTWDESLTDPLFGSSAPGVNVVTFATSAVSTGGDKR